MLYTLVIPSPVGNLTLASDGAALIGLWMDGQKYFLGKYREAPSDGHALPVFMAASAWLDAYFSGARPNISALPLAPMGSEFAQIVWRLLCEIPYGETLSYGALAARTAALLGRPHMSAQAVGGAVGHNPISIIIPCHRIVGANGSLTGYAGGIERKIFLLRHEGHDMRAFTLPGKGTAL